MVLSWTLSDLEVLSALLRLGREGAVKQEGVDTALSRFEDFWGEVHVLAVADAVKARARRLLRVHSLSAADSLQLAAALAAVHDDPRGLGFVSLDDRLCAAAGREGFKVLP
jgi:predicted nucleic acid-binding protein